MELGIRIKELRNVQGINQDELANKLFVSRQTVSNWENGKSYPDIQSVLLLSEIFDVSVDNLLKGDIEKMEKIVTEDTQQDINKMTVYVRVMVFFYGIMLVSAPILVHLIGLWFLIPYAIEAALGIYFAYKVEGIKKKHDVQTYKEIIRFSKGERLTHTEKIEEKVKRPYQKVLSAIISGLIAIVIFVGLQFILLKFLK